MGITPKLPTFSYNINDCWTNVKLLLTRKNVKELPFTIVEMYNVLLSPWTSTGLASGMTLRIKSYYSMMLSEMKPNSARRPGLLCTQGSQETPGKPSHLKGMHEKVHCDKPMIKGPEAHIGGAMPDSLLARSLWWHKRQGGNSPTSWKYHQGHFFIREICKIVKRLLHCYWFDTRITSSKHYIENSSSESGESEESDYISKCCRKSKSKHKKHFKW